MWNPRKKVLLSGMFSLVPKAKLPLIRGTCLAF